MVLNIVMVQEDRYAAIKKRFFNLFIAMATHHGIPYASGFLIGWLSYLARYDHSIMLKLENLESKYNVKKDGRP